MSERVKDAYNAYRRRAHGKGARWAAECWVLWVKTSVEDVIERYALKSRIESKCNKKSAPIPQEARTKTTGEYGGIRLSTGGAQFEWLDGIG